MYSNLLSSTSSSPQKRIPVPVNASTGVVATRCFKILTYAGSAKNKYQEMKEEFGSHDIFRLAEPELQMSDDPVFKTSECLKRAREIKDLAAKETRGLVKRVYKRIESSVPHATVLTNFQISLFNRMAELAGTPARVDAAGAPLVFPPVTVPAILTSSARPQTDFVRWNELNGYDRGQLEMEANSIRNLAATQENDARELTGLQRQLQALENPSDLRQYMIHAEEEYTVNMAALQQAREPLRAEGGRALPERVARLDKFQQVAYRLITKDGKLQPAQVYFDVTEFMSGVDNLQGLVDGCRSMSSAMLWFHTMASGEAIGADRQQSNQHLILKGLLDACPSYRGSISVLDPEPSQTYFSRVLAVLERAALHATPSGGLKAFDLSAFTEAQTTATFFTSPGSDKGNHSLSTSSGGVSSSKQFRCRFGNFCANQSSCDHSHDCEPRMCWKKNCRRDDCYFVHDDDVYDESKMRPGFKTHGERDNQRDSSHWGDRSRDRDRSRSPSRYRSRSSSPEKREDQRRQSSHQQSDQQAQQNQPSKQDQWGVTSSTRSSQPTGTSQGGSSRWYIIAKGISDDLKKPLCFNSYVRGCDGKHHRSWQCAKFNPRGARCSTFDRDKGCFAAYSADGCPYNHSSN